MRSEIIKDFKEVLSRYCHNKESFIPSLAEEIIGSGKFATELGISLHVP